MISFEQRASDPQRLFQPSFQLVEEEKSRKRAYVLLLKLEGSLIDMLEKFESGKCAFRFWPAFFRLFKRTHC